MKKRTIKGWALYEELPAGLNNMPCRAFFRRRHMADKVAADFKHRALNVVPATLTLTPPKRGRKDKT